MGKAFAILLDQDSGRTTSLIPSHHTIPNFLIFSMLKMSLENLLNRWQQILAISHSRKKVKVCLLLYLPLELFIDIANRLTFTEKLSLAQDTAYFGFMFHCPEIWSM
jgi:hypothetical protein